VTGALCLWEYVKQQITKQKGGEGDIVDENSEIIKQEGCGGDTVDEKSGDHKQEGSER
jgi:hypothetical protein